MVSHTRETEREGYPGKLVVVEEFRAVAMDQGTEGQTVLPAVNVVSPD